MKVVGNDPIKTLWSREKPSEGGARRIEARWPSFDNWLELLGRVPTDAFTASVRLPSPELPPSRVTSDSDSGKLIAPPKFLTRQVKCVQQAVYGQPRRNKP